MFVYQIQEYPRLFFSSAQKAKRWARSRMKSKLLQKATVIVFCVDGLALSGVVSELSSAKGEWLDNYGHYYDKGKRMQQYLAGKTGR